jgi:hypothetical protein
MRFLTALLLCNSLIFLSVNLSYAEMTDINRIFHSVPSFERFEVCQGGGCAIVSVTNIKPTEWNRVSRLFKPVSKTAEEERSRIAKAVGLIEDIVGQKIGTVSDRAGTFDNSKYSGQQDCNDEAINTTTYMRFLKQSGLVLFHEIEDTRTRNFFFTGWPHTTAVIREVSTGERYAVDSWFYDNGHAATIVPFAIWKDNYFPKDSPITHSRD